MSEPKEKIRLKCLGCNSTLQVSIKSIGKTARCPKCQNLTPISRSNGAKAAKPSATSQQGNHGNSPSRRRPQGASTSIQSQPLQSQALDFLPPLSSSIPAADPNFYAYSAPVRPRANKGFPVWAIWLLGGMGTIVLGMVLVGVGMSMIGAMRSVQEIRSELEKTATASSVDSVVSAGVSLPSSSQDTALTPVSPLPSSTTDNSTGATVYLVSDPNRGGGQTRMRIYVPSGQHEPKSLPCVFIAPAGTTLLTGIDIGSEENMQELRPFIDAKMIVVCYSLDGAMPEVSPDDPRYMKELTPAFQKFFKSDAGVHNGQVAINRVLNSFPEVDSGKLYTSGHSSAATLALLLASKDQRISKALAFAPITDLGQRFDGILAEPAMTRILPGIANYLISGSPRSFASQIKAEVWIAHAKDDDNEPFQNTASYVQSLVRRNVVFVSPETGGHYGDFLYSNIPNAIRWLQAD